jgi:UDP-3-O-[3-hydroxymyristoyl] glucosamine N-acyltransferase
MEFSVAQIAQLLNGTIEGDSSLKIRDLTKIEEGRTGAISFLANPKYESHIYETASSAVIVNKDFVPKKNIQATLIRVDNAYLAFTQMLEAYEQLLKTSQVGIENPSFIGQDTQHGEGLYLGAFAVIGKNCIIGKNVKIHSQASIGDRVNIGDNTIIYNGVRVMADCKIGQNCVIHPNAVIGSDGFGFAPQPDGSYRPIPQLGNVILEDNVSIGANSTIDRATLGSTIIRKGVKLDNLVMVAHNVEIGQHTVIAAMTGIAGSTKVGENCMIGGQVGIIGHITLANRTSINAQSGLFQGTKTEGQVLCGYPAIDQSQFRKSSVIFKQLPDLAKRIYALEKAFRAAKT